MFTFSTKFLRGDAVFQPVSKLVSAEGYDVWVWREGQNNSGGYDTNVRTKLVGLPIFVTCSRVALSFDRGWY